MRTLGIVGAIGPESTIQYYRTIIALFRQSGGDGSYPQLIISSIAQHRGDSVRRSETAGLETRRPFGTCFTRTASFYPAVFRRAGIELILPDKSEQAFIHNKYMNELVPGNFLPGTKRGLLQIVERMAKENDVDSILRAETELLLILREPAHGDIPLIDTMHVHARAAVAEML